MKRTLVISVLAIILLDQASKWFMLHWLLDPAIRVPVLPFLDFVLAWNRGISFGIFGDGGIPPWALLVIAILIAGWLAWMGLNADSRWGAISYGLIVGGALGNAIDRGIHGAVVDFIFLHADGFSWPVFNLADSAITVGVVMILIETLFFARPVPK